MKYDGAWGHAEISKQEAADAAATVDERQWRSICKWDEEAHGEYTGINGIIKAKESSILKTPICVVMYVSLCLWHCQFIQNKKKTYTNKSLEVGYINLEWIYLIWMSDAGMQMDCLNTPSCQKSLHARHAPSSH